MLDTILEGQRVFERGVGELALGWRMWIYWMLFMNLIAALPFAFARTEARVILVVFLMNAAFMFWLAGRFGYEKILGLSHVVFWTPMIVYLIARFRSRAVPATSFYGRYVAAVILTDSISLVIDCVDVARYLLGARAGA